MSWHRVLEHVPCRQQRSRAPTLPASVLKSTKTRGPTRGEVVERSIIPVCAQDSVVLAPSTMSSTTRAEFGISVRSWTSAAKESTGSGHFWADSDGPGGLIRMGGRGDRGRRAQRGATYQRGRAQYAAHAQAAQVVFRCRGKQGGGVTGRFLEHSQKRRVARADRFPRQDVCMPREHTRVGGSHSLTRASCTPEPHTATRQGSGSQ